MSLSTTHIPAIQGREELIEATQTLRATYGATRMAAFVEEAAQTYEERGLFTYRF